MPGINGFEFLRCLRSLEHTSRVPLIMLSGTTRSLKELVVSESTYFLSKPFQAEELIQLVRKAIRLPGDGSPTPVPAGAGQDDARVPPAASKTEINFRTLVMRAGNVGSLFRR